MRKLVIGGVAAFVLCGAAPAVAADMAVKAPLAAPVAAYDWSGFYLGIDGGWQGSRIGVSSPGAPVSFLANHSSGALGGFGGVQGQFGQIVLGVEGGYVSGFGNASGASPSIDVFFPGGTGAVQIKMRDIWSVGGRAGWALGHWMPYVTGGYANGSFEFDAQDVPADGITETAKAFTGGGYIGGGLDYAFANNWIIGAEYRHYGFSTKTVTAVATNFTEPVTFAPRTDTVVARLSYKFNWLH
jgi:outer membrane immunogenic protein